MKKSMTRKIVAVMLVVMMLASVCFTYTASAAGLTITPEPYPDHPTSEYYLSGEYSVLTDGVKDGAYNKGATVIFSGGGAWTDYILTFDTATTINTVVIYGAAPAGGGSWNIGDEPGNYDIVVNGNVIDKQVSVDRTNADYPVATITFDTITTTSFIVEIQNTVWLSAIYEIEAYLAASNAPEDPDISEEVSEEASEEVSEEVSEEASEEASEESSEEPEEETAVIVFDNSSYNWSTVYAYIYTDGGAKNGDWPGQEMNYDEETGLFYLELTGDLAAYGKVMFTEAENASTNRYPADQQPGLDIAGKDMLFSADHSWTEIPAEEEKVEINYAAGKTYTTEGTLNYYGTPDDGTFLTDGILADGSKLGQMGFQGGDSVNTITIDLGKKYTDIDKLVFNGCRISGNRQFADLVIEVSNNGSSFKTIDPSKYVREDVEVGDPMYDVVIDFADDITARYVRITCTNTEFVFSLSEIQVIGYGAEGEAEPGDAGIVVVSVIALISLAGAVIVSKRRFN